MSYARAWSNRWRIAAPLSAAGALALRRFPALAQNASPVPAEPNPLMDMIELLPLSAGGSESNLLLATFADLAAQLAAVGTQPPPAVDRGDPHAWISAISQLPIADPFGSRFLQLTRDLFGFDLTDVDQTLQAGEPPDMPTLLRGRFNRDAVAAAWQANGYKLLDVNGTQVASLAEDPSFDFNNPIQRLVLARMNNAAFLPDGTLAYCGSLDNLKAVIATATGAAASLATRIDLARLVTGLDRVYGGAILLSGLALTGLQISPDMLSTPISDLATSIASAIASADDMPPVLSLLVGATPGGPLPVRTEGTPVPMPSGTVLFELLMAEDGAAARAKPVVEARLAAYTSVITRQPLSDRFASWDVRVDAARNILEIELTPNETTPLGIWLQMVYSRDLGFIAW